MCDFYLYDCLFVIIYIAPLKVTRVEQTIRTKPVYTQTVEHRQPGLDYRHFLDFGFFNDAASYYGGAPVQHQPLTVHKEVRKCLNEF